MLFDKCEVKEQVLAELDRIKNFYLTKASVSKQNRYLINVSGIPGAGKTTYCKKILETSKEFNYISFDEIMEQISHYKIDANVNQREAFLTWEAPAKILGYEILIELLLKGSPILFEHSSANYEHLELFKYIKEHLGYKIEMVFIPIALKDALSRIKKRERATKRYIPEEIIVDRKFFLQEAIPKYKKIVDVYKEAK